MLLYETEARKQGFNFVVGIDEAGRGPLAGPVVACAVSLKNYSFQNKIDDSKKLTSSQRDKAFKEIFEKAYVSVGMISSVVIDEINILNATYVAMDNAVRQLIVRAASFLESREIVPKDICLLVDGNRFKSDLPYSFKTIVSGDSLSLSIACASIVAKVTRDRILCAYDKVYPAYGLARHKGYPTRLHKDAILRHGLSPIHRRSFKHL